jgi:hypothetical protein
MSTISPPIIIGAKTEAIIKPKYHLDILDLSMSSAIEAMSNMKKQILPKIRLSKTAKY